MVLFYGQPSNSYERGNDTSAWQPVFWTAHQDPRWWCPAFAHGLQAEVKNGPTARSSATDAHYGGIMVQIQRVYRIQVRGGPRIVYQ